MYLGTTDQALEVASTRREDEIAPRQQVPPLARSPHRHVAALDLDPDHAPGTPLRLTYPFAERPTTSSECNDRRPPTDDSVGGRTTSCGRSGQGSAVTQTAVTVRSGVPAPVLFTVTSQVAPAVPDLLPRTVSAPWSNEYPPLIATFPTGHGAEPVVTAPGPAVAGVTAVTTS